MTPAEHYREAEDFTVGAMRRLERATENTYAEAQGAAKIDLAAAQVHATLALAGATALGALVGHDQARGDLGDALLGLEPLSGRQPWERTIGRAPVEVAARLAREAGR